MEKTLLEKLILANKVLDKAGLTVPFGHVSARIAGTDRFLISRAVAPGIVTEKDILMVNLDGKVLEGEGRMHGETWIHVCIYRARPEVNGIVHTNSLYLTALATAERTFIPATIFSMPFANAKVYTKAGLINNEERGSEMALLLGNDAAVLLKGHGGSVAGRNVEEAAAQAIMVEEAARIQILAGIAGKVTPYAADELARFRQELKEQAVRNDRPAGLFERVWEYYKSKVEEKG